MGSDEAFRQSLFHPLVSGKTYQLRIKTASFGESNFNLCVNAHFTRWGEHWYANSNNNNKLVIGSFCSYGNWHFSNWSERVINFTVDAEDNNLLTNITIRCATEGDGNSRTRLVDDVELYEYCPPVLLFENQRFSYNSPAPYEGYRVLAGYNVGNTVLGNGNVIIGSHANITFKGVYDIVLDPGFETETGAEFLAYTAPCGATEFPLPSSKTINHCLNANEPTVLSLGGLYNPLYHYEWMPHDFLTSPYEMSTNLVIPPYTFTNDGTLVYYLHVFDDQNNEVHPPTPFVINYTTGIELLWISTAFSPPGNNPTFNAYTRGVSYFEFYVFARNEWILISSGPVNLPSPQLLVLWDGNYQGSPAQLGSYSYRLDLYDDCGHYESMNGNVILYRSHNIRIQYYINTMGQKIEDLELAPFGVYIKYTEYDDGTINCEKIFVNETN